MNFKGSILLAFKNFEKDFRKIKFTELQTFSNRTFKKFVLYQKYSKEDFFWKLQSMDRFIPSSPLSSWFFAWITTTGAEAILVWLLVVYFCSSLFKRVNVVSSILISFLILSFSSPSDFVNFSSNFYERSHTFSFYSTQKNEYLKRGKNVLKIELYK